MWELYDRLIDGIPEDVTVTDYCTGCAWTYVENSRNHIGVALTVKSYTQAEAHPENLTGKSLRQVANLVKSWNFLDASIGAAAINSWYNSPDNVEALGGFEDQDLEDDDIRSRTKKDAFIAFSDEVRGKKVACIGHFPNIEKQLMEICDLSILERNPSKDDYPDSACEYILPQQDIVFMTGMTLTNKTLPRLLQISRRNAKISIVGPSIPCAPVLKEFGVDNISGFCVTEPSRLKERVCRGGQRDIFHAGRMVSVDFL